MAHKMLLPEGYTPHPAPDPREVHAFSLWIQRELEALSRILQETKTLELRPRHAAPQKPREGMIVYADGSHWDPGKGEGFYGYSNGKWVLLGGEGDEETEISEEFLSIIAAWLEGDWDVEQGECSPWCPVLEKSPRNLTNLPDPKTSAWSTDATSLWNLG